jgi:hypothetical protein
LLFDVNPRGIRTEIDFVADLVQIPPERLPVRIDGDAGKALFVAQRREQRTVHDHLRSGRSRRQDRQ